MDEIRKTLKGIRNMPEKAYLPLKAGILQACGMLSAAILLLVSAESDTYSSFKLAKMAQELIRLGSILMYIGLIRSLSSVEKETK